MTSDRHECIWFDQRNYESAEAVYQADLVNRFLGLRVEGKAVAKNPISSDIEKAMNLIGKSLKTTASPNASADMENRITKLELDNTLLKSKLENICARLSVLEGQHGVNETNKKGKTKKAESDDDFDLFASEDDEEIDEIKQERLQKYAEKKAKKPSVVAKSSLILDVKPWDDETDIFEMESKVRSVCTEGLLWGASKSLPVAYGIKKLQISCVIEDDKVGTDFLEESILAFEDLVQSVDIVAFNKI